MIEFEKFLAPWEHDKDGKALEEPADIVPDKLKKFLYNLLSDKEKLQEKVADQETAVADAQEQLAQVQREHEDDAARQAREQKERETRYEQMEKRETERRKVEAIEEAFREDGITLARAKKLAKRVSGDDEKTWIEEAKDLVADGFRVSDANSGTQQQERVNDDETDDLQVTPRVTRNGAVVLPAEKATKRNKSVADELDAAGIGRTAW